MGRPTDPNFWQQSPPPQTGDMNNERTLNQRFMRELPGALPPQDVIIHDGAISGFESAALIVDTEGEAAADELNVINIVLSANENLHPGMIITLRAKDQARTVTVKNSAAANGINTAGGHDVVLSTEWDLVLRLVAGRWYEIQTRGDVRASDAQTDASTALARTNPATTTSRGICRVATLADMGPDAVIENGPAFLAAGDVVSVIEKWRFIVGEFYYFRHPTLKTGFAPAQGGLISGYYQGKHITEYPIWAYLQTAEGQLLCKTEAQWKAMTTATWHTNADGSKVGWDGIGGAPFYVQNLGAGTLRVPDIRGMYAEAAGLSLNAGNAKGDAVRPIVGDASLAYLQGAGTGAFASTSTGPVQNIGGGSGGWRQWVGIAVGGTGNFLDISRVTPVGPVNAPRSWGSLACCYLGIPAS